MRIAFSVVFAALLATQGAYAADDAKAPASAPAPAAAAAVKVVAAKPDSAAGAKAAQVCAACHGPDGNSPVPAYPKLAGQHPEYLAKQLAAFKANTDRKNPVMMPMATVLSPDDMRNVAAYFSEQKAKEGSARNAATVRLGEKIYRGGIAEKGVAACAGCHGPAGSGIPAQYPRLAGQWFDYTKLQLTNFRAGLRKNDPAGAMRGVAANLSDPEIDAVSDYIAGLKSVN
jgi:cytochrome c553